jgi:ribosomal protein L21
MDKFVVACMIFSFISGAYFVELIETHREHDKVCVIKFMQGKETMVTIGHTPDE